MEKGTLLEVFEEITKLNNASCYKRLSDKKQAIKLKIDDKLTLIIVYEVFGKAIASYQYFKRGEKKIRNKIKYEYITCNVLVDGVVKDKRSVDSIEELNSIIREYTETIDAREILKTFAKKYNLKLKKKKYALPMEMYVFSSLVIRVFKNGVGTEYLIANKRTPEEMAADIITFDSCKHIQSLEELEELYVK